MAEIIQIKPQAGPQEQFLSTPADIAIYGGAAGGGKTFAMLLEGIRNHHIPGFGGVIFRRESTQIRKEGGIWDESLKIYSYLGGVPRESLLDWKFPRYGTKISFSHLEQEKTKYDWHGAQIPFIGFEELTQFTKTQFFYMFSRNRSTCGVKPYIRANCNPDSDSWVADLISWYIDQQTGYPIKERSGVIRYFIRVGEELIWGNSKEELINNNPGVAKEDIKSFTFIASSVYDNKILLEKDPGYLSNLKALSLVERERLLNGNWKIKPSAGLYFKKRYFEIVDAVPAYRKAVRYWDLAATEAEKGKQPDYTVGLKLSVTENGVYYVNDVERFQGSPLKVEQAIKNFAALDSKAVHIGLPQDPGQAGKAQAESFVRMLSGYVVKAYRETGDKVTRASPVSAQAEAGNVKILRGAWNEAFLNELENFPGPKDDQVDALSGAFNALQEPRFKAWG